ncbi:hypothetical protein HSB1_02930 [Halogranum salarium B-1]|uniref:Uncharacterized protein n=1 Tax=Halogranum salarium B-1 TaxID=1210908 RepID=J3EZY5_9EURY|nr:hypothetical protein HSB1_02930 [Halogranum salarium B-1]
MGLKGDALSTKADDASTAGTSVASDEEHSESPESIARGLSRGSRIYY